MSADNSSNVSPSAALLRTVVFIDYQNMYRGAREAFGWQAEGGHFGNFRPYAFARRMARSEGCVLSQVRAYAGIHTPQRNAAQNAQLQRRIRPWIADAPEKVELFPRPLRYSAQRPKGEEKGVDVELAIDIVRLALDGAIDVVLLASTDTDLVPPLQFVADRLPQIALMTAAWEPVFGCEGETAAPLDLPRGNVERLRVSKREFDRMADKRNFYLSSTDASIDPNRWDRIKRRFGPQG